MWLKGEKFKSEDRKKILVLSLIFLVLILSVFGFEEYKGYMALKGLDWRIKEKEDVLDSPSPDIVFVWMSDQNKIVMDFPIVVENRGDRRAVFSRVVFDVSVWGLEAGGGEISQRYIVPANGSRVIWIRNFEVNVRDFENYVFTLAKGGGVKVDIDISITAYYPFLFTELEGGRAMIRAEYPLEEDVVEEIVSKKLVPFIGAR